MLVNLKEILNIAEKGNFAIPAFNVYNMETVIGIFEAADAAAAQYVESVKKSAENLFF